MASIPAVLEGSNALTAETGLALSGPAAPDLEHEDVSESSRVSPHELRFAEDWLAAISPNEKGGFAAATFLGQFLNTAPPFSFRYGGKEAHALLPTWKFHRGQGAGDATSEIREFAWAEPSTGLEVTWRLKRFTDYPALESILWFANVGTSDTALLEDIRDLDIRLNHSRKGEAYIVHAAHGGRYRRDDWWPISQYLPMTLGHMRDYEGGSQMSLGDAYPSSRRHLPFVNLETPENRGLVVAIGWTGNWIGDLRVENQELSAHFGLKETSFLLHPGEKVRTARMLLLPWEGKRLHAQNMLRQVLHKHFIPGIRGEERKPWVSVNACFTYNGQGAFLTDANEKNLRPLVEPTAKLGAEVFIVDAGWYPGAPWNKWMGDWTLSPERYPNGFTPVSKPLADEKIAFGVWFAPEVVCQTVPLYHQHPEWLTIKQTLYGGANLRLDLPEAREWFLKQVDDLIAHQGMTCYRQDGYNSEEDCRAKDTSDRKGIYEIQYLMGFYELLDTLRKRHPNLIMEAAAGAARIDIETLSRYHWHQPCETWLHPDLDQCTTYGTSLWMPGGMVVFYNSMQGAYGAWSAFGGQLSLAVDPLAAGFPMDWTRRQVDLYKRVRPYLSGDFYPLTPISLDGTWMGYQYHRTDLRGGFAQIFKRANASPDITPAKETFRMQLRGLNPGAQYRTRFESGNTEKTLPGRELAQGIEIALDKPPAAELVIYEQ